MASTYRVHVGWTRRYRRARRQCNTDLVGEALFDGVRAVDKAGHLRELNVGDEERAHRRQRQLHHVELLLVDVQQADVPARRY